VGTTADKRTPEVQQPQLVRELRRKFIVSAMLAVGLVVLSIVAVINVASWINARNSADAQLEVLASSGGSFEGMLRLRQLEEGADASLMNGLVDGGLAPHGQGQQPPATESQADAAQGQQPPATESPADATADAGAAQDQQPPASGTEADAAQGATTDAGTAPGATTDATTELRDGNPPFGHRRFDDLHGGMTAETPYEMRFFVVRVADGAPVSVDTSRIVSVDEAQASELALQVAVSGPGSGTLDTWRYLVANETDDAGNETLACYFLDCTRDHNRIRSLLLASAAIAVGGLLLVLVLVVLFSQRVVAPVADSYARQRRFITNASHDLKTPLAVIQSDVEVIEMLEGPGEWTDSIRHQVGRLTDLTNKLVMLSRMDEGMENVHPADFDLEAVVETVAHEFDPVAATQGKRIRVAAEPRLTAHADASLVDQLLHLLLDNALKYSSDGATIDLRAGRERNRCVIRVANPVDQIEPGSHDELFERFSRADSARSSSGGHGIGLAVVRAIAEAHGGDAHCASADGHSIEFVVRL